MTSFADRTVVRQTPEPGRAVLAKLRATIRAVLPRDAADTISYGIPAFARDGVIVWYAVFADHVSPHISIEHPAVLPESPHSLQLSGSLPSARLLIPLPRWLRCGEAPAAVPS